MDRAAKEGNPDAVAFKRVYLDKGSYDFSFSGLKTQVINYVHTEKMRGHELSVPDISASFQQAVVDVIVDKAVAAAEERGEQKLVMAGGVAANSRLREEMQSACDAHGIRLYRPDPVLCTDNGAMIASAAYYKYRKHGADGLDLDAYANLPL